jgi:C_GCAxxG_C_C family probable redox protein
MQPDIKPFELDERVQKAVSLFKSGYNCAQSVVGAYADVVGLDLTTAMHISASFGGGMGRLREVCGAVSGMFILLGYRYPACNPQAPDAKSAKTANYAAVQRTAAVFGQTMGSIICRDLLAVRKKERPEPSDRNAEYYAVRPCTRCVALAAEIAGRELAAGY